MNVTRKTFQWAYIGIFISFILAIALRTYHWNTVTVFNGDDGMDLSIVWNMEYEQHRSLVGPFLSVPNFYTPPTYYYLTWLFYHFSPGPDGVRIGYLFMNVLSMTVLVYLTSKIGNRNAAVITGILYAASRVLIFHGRAYWQPFPMQLFLALTLLCMYLAYQKKSAILLWSSAVSYTIALSVYPSPVILLPLMVYHLITWHRTMKHDTLLLAAAKAAIILGCTAACIYAPQLIFELQNGFPTFHTLAATTPADSISPQFLQTMLSHAATSVTNVIQNQYMLSDQYRNALPFIYVLLLLITHRLYTQKNPDSRKTTLDVGRFFPPLIIFSGFLFTYFIPDPAPHRVWAMIPVIIVSTALITEHALRKGFLPATVAVVILFLYLWGNITGIYIDYTDPPVDAISLTKRVAANIMNDMEKSIIARDKMQLIYILPDNSTPHYTLNRILYWMIAAKKLDIPLSAKGNRLDYDVYTSVATKPTVYLLCHEFVTAEQIDRGCVAPFTAINPSYIITERHDDPLLSLVILTKNEAQEAIDGLQRAPANKQW